jgi:hypothetical protein
MMTYIIMDRGEVFVGFREDWTPEWSTRPDIEHVAQRFSTKEQAASVRSELRALGLNPKSVPWNGRAKKQTVMCTDESSPDRLSRRR